MIKEIHLSNYRGFNDHKIELKRFSIIVGKNNAGKSTIIEALKIISIVVENFEKINYSAPPSWTGLPPYIKGVSPSIRSRGLDFKTVTHRYADPPAKIESIFENGEIIEIYLNNNSLYAVLKDSSGKNITTKSGGKNITTKSGALKMNLGKVSILPQIGPLQKNELVLKREYVNRYISSNLLSYHFRNQLYISDKSVFDDFKDLVGDTWSGLRIRDIEIGESEDGDSIIALFVQDGDFIAEVSWMGHGLQMWMQIIWFLSRSKDSNTVILDEPDVYMHPDLQRKLIRFLRGRFPQVIVATHSSEIIADVDYENILVIDRSKNRSIYTSSLPAVQKITEHIGSAHNIHLTRLWSTRKVLAVEGKDVSLLKKWHDTLFPNTSVPMDMIPSINMGGWGGWNYAIGSHMVLKNASNDGINVYCIFDSDYHVPSDISKRKQDGVNRGLYVHIWSKKEIENYLIVPSVIKRVIENRSDVDVSISVIEDKLTIIAEGMKNEVTDNIAAEIQKNNRGFDINTVNSNARNIVDSKWNDLYSRLSICSGKKIISELSNWSKINFSVSFNSANLAGEMKKNEIDLEVAKLLEQIERCE